MSQFLDLLSEKVVVFDGAMGTSIQAFNLTPDDFWGYDGCNDLLVLSKPEAIREIHASFLDVGCDVIETNTFGANSVVLSEYDLQDKVYEINKSAAELAKNIAYDFSTSDRRRWVAGSIGPGTKLPSLGHITFNKLKKCYDEQVLGLFQGGVDMFIVETCQDLLQAKAVIIAIHDLFKKKRVKLPLIVSVTMETSGTMLLGTDMQSVLTTLLPLQPDVIGVNCATGPKVMSEHVRTLAAYSPKFISVIPNAGLPKNVDGKTVYDLTPEEMAKDLHHFCKDIGANIVGGCCGTTPKHIQAMVEAVSDLLPLDQEPSPEPSIASLYTSQTIHVEPKPLIIGERTNANGSKAFREFLLKDDLDGMMSIAQKQVNEQAHLLDVCTAYVGRNEVQDMDRFIFRLNTQCSIPLMIDSTNPIVIETALQRIAGRAIINSINLEDGEEQAEKIIDLCKRYGAGLVCLTIDENGMAKTSSEKLSIAKRIYDLAINGGLNPSDLLFDALTFTLGSGDEEFRKSAIETFEAIKSIKAELPGVFTILGVSNCSFGLNPQLRHYLNSVFLHHAIEYGLDAAIVHAGKILPLYKIPEDVRKLCDDLVFDRRDNGYDPLIELISLTEKLKEDKVSIAVAEKLLPIEERLKRRIIDGSTIDLEKDIEIAMRSHEPLKIINEFLLDGMKTVGELFASGEMQLPFVLQSAETMKKAVAILEPHMEKVAGQSRGKMIIATVRGDVHDIGKNLVDIILTNNGYEVINLGIKQPIDSILQAWEEYNSDVIGMSGLLVKSTIVMKENLEVMNDRGIHPPVILGGAALTRHYVEKELSDIYKGEVYYAKDVFDGLTLLEEIGKKRNQQEIFNKGSKSGKKSRMETGTKPQVSNMITSKRSFNLADPKIIPTPPFWGSRVVDGIPLDILFPYINKIALFRGQWGFKKRKLSKEKYEEMIQSTAEPAFEHIKELVKRERILEPKIVYGYFQCQSDGDDLIIYDPQKRDRVNTIFSFPRQKKGKFRSISDFFMPVKSGVMDVIAFHLVTVGSKATAKAMELFEKNHYQDYLYLHGFSVEMAEALAEYWHKEIRREMGIDSEDADETQKLFSQGYRGCRYSLGYPACPNLEDQTKIFKLLQPERIGVSLTEGYQLVPEQSTSAIIVHHPEARYFSV